MNDNKTPTIVVTFPFIIRDGEKLAFIGDPSDERKAIVEKISDGHGGQADWDLVADLPVFDDENVNPSRASLFVTERRRGLSC